MGIDDTLAGEIVRRVLATAKPDRIILWKVEPELKDACAEAGWLSPFAVDARYPGDLAEALPGDESRAINLARLVLDAVMKVLVLHLS